ncbi:MAG: hypothetical protein PHI12_15040 [Dehalococcoidales bacterium]|nr:hypothetical protein [Dehalococcoidales bacterium]
MNETRTTVLAIKTYDDIMALEPCYDPAEVGYCTHEWRGTALDVLRAENIPAKDRLWLVLNDGWVPDRTLHEFAIWCAEQALALIETPDPRSLRALEIKRAWLDGMATDDELAAAEAAAEAAARDAARDAAWAAARAAAEAAARDAARDVARDAAWAAARAAAEAAARDAAPADIRYLLKRIAELELEVEMLRDWIEDEGE